jgi:hypothetical protein
MARVLENKRIHLRDLIPPGRRHIQQKKFINCEIIGPGNLLLGLRLTDASPQPDFKNNRFYDVDFVEIDPSTAPETAISFFDCDFDGCHLYSLTLFFYTRFRDDWNWITPRTDSPRLLENQDVVQE